MAISKKFFSIFTLAVSVGAFSVIASAQVTAPAPKEVDKKVEKMDRKGFGRHGGKFGRMGGMHRGMGLFGVTLTDAQKEQIKAIHEANKPSQETMELRRSLMEARRAGTLTDAQKEQMKQLREEQRSKMKSVHGQVLAILTPEQKAQIEAKRIEMKQLRKERRQRMQTNKSEVKPTENK